MFFRRENCPEGAAKRCLDCPLEPSCPYSAPRFYLERWKAGHIDNYIESVTSPLTEENILKAMREGPYGRCVFACDNDVADHQVVNMEFCDGKKILLYSYLRDRTTEINIEPDNGTPAKYHGGGDKNCLESFIDALRENNPELIVSGADISLETHLMVFAAERSRKEKRTILMDELRSEK